LNDLVEFLETKSNENPFLEWEEKLDKDAYGRLVSGERTPSWDENIGNPKVHIEDDEKRRYLQSLITQPQKLADVLLYQLHTQTLDARIIAAGEYIINNLDEHGYLLVSAEDLEKTFDLTRQEAEDSIKLIQSFSPPGVAARSLQECLLIQIRQQDLGALEEKIIQECFEEFKKTNLKNIAKKLKVDLESIKGAFMHLRKLNPHPASSFYGHSSTPITPEFKVVKAKGALMIEKIYFPKIYINKGYMKMIKGADEDTSAFLKEKLKEAKETIEALKRREEVLNKVILRIVNVQRDYLEGGSLRDVSLDDIAEDCSLDKYSVSKAIAGKYIDYQGQIYKIKNLLVHKKAKGKSKSEVETIIRDLFDQENKEKPYSDQDVEKILRKKGYTASRRTITKYRLKMKIPNAYMRKNIKSLD